MLEIHALISFTGPSLPSSHSSVVCTTLPDVPYNNPSNVIGEGTTPQNLVISWTPMSQIEHNGPGFQYKVSYKRDIPNLEWVTQYITDWRKSSLMVDNVPTYQRYRIKVSAMNDKGESKALVKEVIGFSGEDGNLLTLIYQYKYIKSRLPINLST